MFSLEEDCTILVQPITKNNTEVLHNTQFSHGDFPWGFPWGIKRILLKIAQRLRNNFPQVYKQVVQVNYSFYFKVVEGRRAIQDVQVRYLREYFYKRA